jgi:hypothetical protein
MQSLDDEERKEVLGEVMFDEFRVIREYVQDIPLIKKKLHEVDERLIKVEERVSGLEVDVSYMRRAVT